MKISLNWLTDFVEITEKDPNVIMETLTERSAEIEELIDLGKDFEHVVVGKILEITPHPNADKVRVTKIDVGDDTIRQIICGAQNIEVGQKVPVALPGAILPGDFRIEKRPMRGVDSEGMLCSGKELGLAEDAKGIYILEVDAPLGKPLAEHLGIGGYVFDIDNTAITNRPDLFSQYGFARELVANGLAKWKKKEWDFTEIEKQIPNTPLPVRFTIESPELCPARGEIVIENIKIADSPDWLKQRLVECGIRPINNIVDVSNYVMLELGMPLHTFDFDKINGNKITMRESAQGDKVTTLDGIERELPAGVIVNEDATGIFDLAGIMGGENSEISDSTTKVLVHVPVYDPIRIRKAMLKLGHRTDAATIYEKRVPNASVMPGLLRTVQLILKLCPDARVASGIEFIEHIPAKEQTILLPLAAISRVLGKPLSAEEIIGILKQLDFEVLKQEADSLSVSVPPHRLSDITMPEDLIEEVVRIYGINSLEAEAPNMAMQATLPDSKKTLINEITDILTSFGCMQMVNFAFLGPDLLKRCGIEPNETMVEIENPLSLDQSLLRQSLLPRLLEKAAENRRERHAFDIFEIGKTFFISENGEKSERLELACLSVGKDFSGVKSLLEGLADELSLPIKLDKPNAKQPIATNETAIMLQNSEIGSIFEINQKGKSKFSLPEKTAGFSLLLEPMAFFPRKNKKVSLPPRFPAIELDLSVLADKHNFAGEIVKGLRQLDNRIEAAEVLDVFAGEGVPEGKKSVTLHFSFRATDKTLTSTDESELKTMLLNTLQKRGYQYRF